MLDADDVDINVSQCHEFAEMKEHVEKELKENDDLMQLVQLLEKARGNDNMELLHYYRHKLLDDVCEFIFLFHRVSQKSLSKVVKLLSGCCVLWLKHACFKLTLSCHFAQTLSGKSA